MRLAAIAVVAGCWTGSPPPATTTSGDGAELATTADVPACIYDERARRRCNGRGSGFDYGPEPYIYCRGIPPEPDDHARFDAEMRTRRCVCNNAAEIAERRLACSQIP